MTPRVELECQRYTVKFSSDIGRTFESHIGKRSQQHLKDVRSEQFTVETKWTYAQGTKLMAVAGGIKPVPLKMTGLESSVSIQFGNRYSKYFGKFTCWKNELISQVEDINCLRKNLT